MPGVYRASTLTAKSRTSRLGRKPRGLLLFCQLCETEKPPLSTTSGSPRAHAHDRLFGTARSRRHDVSSATGLRPADQVISSVLVAQWHPGLRNTRPVVHVLSSVPNLMSCLCGRLESPEIPHPFPRQQDFRVQGLPRVPIKLFIVIGSSVQTGRLKKQHWRPFAATRNPKPKP